MKNNNKIVSSFIWSTGNMTFAPMNLKEKLADFATIVKVLIHSHPAMNNAVLL